MARGDQLKAGYRRRVRTSGKQLIVHYPPARPATTGLSPTTRPVSPLGNAPVVTAIPTPTTTPMSAPVTLDCLWYDAASLALGAGQITTNLLALVDGTRAVASVLADDAAVDANLPLRDTVFTGCDHVEHGGTRYRVLDVRPIDAGFYKPHAYLVFLGGAAKQ